MTIFSSRASMLLYSRIIDLFLAVGSQEFGGYKISWILCCQIQVIRIGYFYGQCSLIIRFKGKRSRVWHSIFMQLSGFCIGSCCGHPLCGVYPAAYWSPGSHIGDCSYRTAVWSPHHWGILRSPSWIQNNWFAQSVISKGALWLRGNLLS